MGLLKNHLLVALRSMMRFKFYSFINILGLSTAIALVLLVSLFVQNELGYDQFHTQKDCIYRLSDRKVDVVTELKVSEDAHTSIPLAPALKAEIPAIKKFARMASTSGLLIKKQTPYRETITFVDKEFLEIFDFPMLSGQSSLALQQRNSIVITPAMAEKYFGYEDPMGKHIEMVIKDSTQQMKVTGIIDAKKGKSSITFDFLVPLIQYQVDVSEEIFHDFGIGILDSFVLLEQQADLTELSSLMSIVVQKYEPSSNVRMETGLYPLTGIHFDTDVVGNTTFINPQKIWILVAIAALVLIVATINFITLSTGHALVRLKEIGLRKTLGAFRGQLRRQFVAEAFFVTFMACAVGVGIALFMLPLFNRLLDTALSFQIGLFSIGVLLSVCGLVALVAGNLQGLTLIKTKAQQALTGKLSASSNTNWFNRILIVIQFTLSILLIIGALIINAQMNYVQNKALGYEEERLLGVSMGGSDDREANRRFFRKYKALLTQEPQVKVVSAAMNPIREKNWTKLRFMQSDDQEEGIFFNLVTPEFVQSMGIEIVEGSDFRPDEPKDSRAILVNEALVRHFGFDDPLNAQIPGKNFDTPHRIMGVVKDFHFSSLHHKIQPLILAVNLNAVRSGITGVTAYVWPPDVYQILVRVGPGELSSIIKSMERAWGKMNANEPFRCEFADEMIAATYKEENRYKNITMAASVFAIGIAWMGLLGLTRLTVQKRTKEIGIRKVLGSNSIGVAALLARPFIMLILFSILIGTPIAWWITSEWLNSFTYRIELSAFEFVLAGVGVLITALLSVGIQSYRVSMANPSECIRHE